VRLWPKTLPKKSKFLKLPWLAVLRGPRSRDLDLTHGEAGLCATAAKFGADPAMLVTLRVPQAFVTAAAAYFRAEVEHHFHDRSVGYGTAYAKDTSSSAHFGTVQIHGDTLAQFSDRLIGQTRIGACNARLGAIEAYFCRAYGKFISISASRGMGF
jgi:hypothetical protein